MFQKELLKWFKKNKRDMPWRESYDPYHVWLSEIMLQQTQVVTVIPYFKRYIEKYPSIEDLANANETEVLKLWEGLGYYSRARRLISCAQEVVSQYDGKMPMDYKALIKLPGIGPYTAGAILSIAYNQQYPAVDGNVKRVFSRYFNVQVPINEPKQHKIFEKLVMDVLPKDARNFNQGLMELGALICKPASPLCEACPIKKHCEAYNNDLQQLLPLYKKRPDKQRKIWSVALIQYEDQLLMEFRDQETLLGQMWGLPSLEIESEKHSEDALKDYLTTYGLDCEKLEYVGQVKHVFTHQIWEMGVFYGRVLSSAPLKKGTWQLINELDAITIGTGYRKVLKLLKEN